MFNFLLSAIDSTNLESFSKFLRMPQVWVALFLCIAGVCLIILARRITRVAKKTDFIADNDRTLVTIKCVGVVCLLFCIVILVFI